MQRVFVLSNTKKPLMPCHPARAKELLKKGKAAVQRHVPFTIILKHRSDGDIQPIELKVDPGSKTTGIALVGEFKRGKRVIFAVNLSHRGQAVKDALESRRALRRSRRARKTRYRAPRFLNRIRPKGWLPPSLRSRVSNVESWGNKLIRFSPLSSITVEVVRFDMQKMENPEISGTEYQQGTLLGYEVREYLLEKWGRKCAYIHPGLKPLLIKAESRGSRQKCLPDKYGFPRTAPKVQKRVFGFQTGDLIEARVTTGKKTGHYIGRVAVRSTGNFNIKTEDKIMHQGISHKFCRIIQRTDGYSYAANS